MYFLFFLLSSFVFAADPPTMDWKADFYERDNQTNTLKGRGHAYFKQGKQEVWADEIEVNFNTNWASANGNVHFFDGTNDIFCDRGNYALSGNEAILEEATLVTGQMVISGAQLRKMSQTHFEMDEGIYTNCNTQAVRDKSAANCPFDWKIYGKHFSVTLEGYAHIYDAIVYAKDLPVAYVPYYLAPAKSKRQTGFLNLQLLTGTRNIGSGWGMPFFWNLGSWHDLTLFPMVYSKAGMHLGASYNYAYSRTRSGIINLYGTQLKYSSDRATPNTGDANHLLGEWALNVQNQFSLGGRTRSWQNLTLVSHPYYPIDFDKDLGALAQLSALRSQISVSVPSDNVLASANVTHFYSLVMPKDSGVDKGSVTQLPTLTLSQKNRPTFLDFISYEVDTKFSNFFRSTASYDTLPVNRTSPLSSRSTFDGQVDYVRTGQRLNIEPRAVVNIPLASGFQLQPTFKAGTFLYHFDVPNSQVKSQEYVDAEVPFSMYLARNYHTGSSTLKTLRHVFQPRLIYAVALYRSATPSHPFFRQYTQPALFSNPRFDILDQVTNFEYMQVELLNRFLRDVGNSYQRFLLISIRNQLNSRRSPFDRRYRSKVGPVSTLVEFALGPIGFQMQGNYEVEKNGSTNESDWSGSLGYSDGGDSLSLSGLYRVRNDRVTNELRYALSVTKTLPAFVDFSASLNYNALKGRPEGYSLGLRFASKPASCWNLSVLYEQSATTGEISTRFLFGFDFGGPMTMSSSRVGL